MQPTISPATVAALTAALKQLPADERSRAALTTLRKILDNAADAPGDPKYRRIRRANKALAAAVLGCPGGLEILLAAGFTTPDAEFLVQIHVFSCDN